LEYSSIFWVQQEIPGYRVIIISDNRPGNSFVSITGYNFINQWHLIHQI